MSTVVTTYQVAGMSCDHCEGTLSRKVSAVDGVSEARADAAEGVLVVTTTGEPDEAAVRAAVDEAGYDVTGVAGAAIAGQE